MKLKRVAVFDFNAGECADIAGEVRHYLAGAGGAAEVREFSQTRDFVYDFKDNPYDAVFITVNDMRGVDTANFIRDLDEDCPIFIVSSMPDFGLEGFRLRALDYLLTPVSAERIRGSLSRIGRECYGYVQN